MNTTNDQNNSNLTPAPNAGSSTSPSPSKSPAGRQQPNEKRPKQGRSVGGAGATNRGPLNDDEKAMLDSILKQRMSNPAAARELLHALRFPNSRFVAMNSASSNQALGILRDLDRAKSTLERNTAFDADRMAARHEMDRKLVDLVTGMVDLTADMALAAGMRKDQLTDRLVQDAYRKKAAPVPATSAEPAAGASA